MITSFTRDCAPKPIAIPPMPAVAIMLCVFTPNSSRIYVSPQKAITTVITLDKTEMIVFVFWLWRPFCLLTTKRRTAEVMARVIIHTASTTKRLTRIFPIQVSPVSVNSKLFNSSMFTRPFLLISDRKSVV